MSEHIGDQPHAAEVLGEVRAYDGFRSVDLVTFREGGNDTRYCHELVRAFRVVAVIAFDPVLNKLVLIRQFRIGAHLRTGLGMTVEIVAGGCEEGEHPRQAAIRELKEEAGLEPIELEEHFTFQTTSGLTDEIVHLFVARIDASKIPKSAGLESESEETFPFLASLDDVLEAIDKNRISNGIANLSLLWFARNREKFAGWAQ